MFKLKLFILLIVLLSSHGERRMLITTDELENHICPEDLEEFLNIKNVNFSSTPAPGSVSADTADVDEETTSLPVPETVDCIGLGVVAQLGLINMRPGSSSEVNTHFYFSSRKSPERVQVHAGNQFGLEWVDFNPSRKTVMIFHGFMSYSNADWVRDMTAAFLSWDDVNVFTVDWSGGSNTWKYWRAVANTRRVGSDVTGFVRQLIAKAGASTKDFHFVGHSLGAHIASYVSYHVGRVARITGLDPAQPCYQTASSVERLDPTDADFVDVIHTNGRLFRRIGLGLPEPAGHADFYPNGGMKQPGCMNSTEPFFPSFFSPSKIRQAICSHGRAYLLFTESLINDNCTFKAYRWNLTYQGVNSSIRAVCDRTSCAMMGIDAIGGRGLPRAKGQYFVLTTEKQPYCPSEWKQHQPQEDLLWDLKNDFRLDRSMKPSTTTDAYADPELIQDDIAEQTNAIATTPRSWWRWILG